MANHPSRAIAAEARRRVSPVFRTGTGNAGWGFRVTHPADEGKSRMVDSGTYAQAIEHRQEALAEMVEYLKGAA